MTHVRSAIRQAFVSVIDAALPNSTYEVLGRRDGKRNRKSDDPRAVVDVRFADVTLTQQTMGDARSCVGALMVSVRREGDEEALDDALDADEVLITNAIYGAAWSALLEEEPELTQVTFARDVESEVAIGVIILRFNVEYRINKRNPEIVRP